MTFSTIQLLYPFQIITKFSAIFLIVFAVCAVSVNAQTYGQQPEYAQSYYGGNYSTETPFKTEVAKLEAFVYRPGKETLPLMQVPRLQKGDVIKVKVAEEAVNGIKPDQSNYDWTLLVAYINPSRNTDAEGTLSEEVRLKEKGWYKDHFFTVPYDCQPIIFFYPKSKYRQKILDFISKRPDDIRQMGEKVIEISNAYAQVSSFLFQLQDLMLRQSNYGYGSYGSAYSSYGGMSDTTYFDQSVEGLARSFNLELPNCWRNNGYSSYSSYGGSNFQMRAQCLTKNIKLDNLNFSVGKMLQQGALMAVGQLTKNYPELSKWITIAAFALDFVLKLTRKSAIRIIPAIVSSSDAPLYGQSYGTSTTYYNPNNLKPTNTTYTPVNSFGSTAANRISLFAMSQPTDREFISVYAFVPHKWQADADPEKFELFPPVPDEPCMHAGKNILRNNDLRLEWMTDTFTRNFRLQLSDNNGWKKDFELKKNLGLNAWEAEISKEDFAVIPKVSGEFTAKILGTRGFNEIESPEFKLLMANGGGYKTILKDAGAGRTTVTLQNTAGNSVCAQNVTYKLKDGNPVVMPLSPDNNFIKFAGDKREITFEIEGEPETFQVQQVGGETINIPIKP